VGLFKKLQENSLYWRYRFITRRYLEVRRWWRTRGQVRRVPQTTPRFRGTAAYNPYARGAGIRDNWRGVAFLAIVAAAWTALSVSSLPQDTLLMGVLRIASLAAITYAFVRFW
jgi:hypothetical protein